jgi:hypothetical protein
VTLCGGFAATARKGMTTIPNIRTGNTIALQIERGMTASCHDRHGLIECRGLKSRINLKRRMRGAILSD